MLYHMVEKEINSQARVECNARSSTMSIKVLVLGEMHFCTHKKCPKNINFVK